MITNGIEAEVKGSGNGDPCRRVFYYRGRHEKVHREKEPFSVRNLKVDMLAGLNKFLIQQLNPIHK